jgi:hypothetical protein
LFEDFEQRAFAADRAMTLMLDVRDAASAAARLLVDRRDRAIGITGRSRIPARP